MHFSEAFVFLEGSGRMGRESFVAGVYRRLSSQTRSVSSAEKNMCLGFQGETTTKKSFPFFQLERSCYFRE